MEDTTKASDVSTDDTSSDFNFDFLFFDSNANDATQNNESTQNVNTAEETNQVQSANDNFEFFFDAFETNHESIDDNNNDNSVNTGEDNSKTRSEVESNVFTTSSLHADVIHDGKFDDIFNFMNHFTPTEEEVNEQEEEEDEKQQQRANVRNGNNSAKPTKTTVLSTNEIEELNEEVKEEDREQRNKCTVEDMHNNNAANKNSVHTIKDEAEDEEEMPPPSSFTLSRSRTLHVNNRHVSSSSLPTSKSISTHTNDNKQNKSLVKRTTSNANKVDKNNNDKLNKITASESLSSDVDKRVNTDKRVDAIPEQSETDKNENCKASNDDNKKEINTIKKERNNRHSSTLPLTGTLELNVLDLLSRAQALVQSANVQLLTDTSSESANKVTTTETIGAEKSQANGKKASLVHASSDLHFNNTVNTLIKQTTHTRQGVIAQTEELQMKAIDTLKLFGPHPTLANIVLEQQSILHDAPSSLFALLLEFLQSDATEKDKEEERRQFVSVTPVAQLLPIINCLLQKLIAVE